MNVRTCSSKTSLYSARIVAAIAIVTVMVTTVAVVAAVVNMIGAIVNNATFIRGSILCPFETRTQSEGLTP